MGNTDNTEDRGYFDTGGWVFKPDPPRIKIDERGMLNLRPFGIGGTDLTIAVTVSRWREIVALAEKAITEHEAAAQTEAAAS